MLRTVALAAQQNLRPRLLREDPWVRLGTRVRRSINTTANKQSTDELQRVRNIGIIAHIDAGKTTTTERMLHYAGFTRRIGDVDRGDTVMDYLAAERERGITIQSAAITFGWRGRQLHLIDTPGHVDFTVEVERALRVLDGAVAIVDAVAGVQAQTLTVWRQAAAYGIPRVVFINKMDREGADYKKCVEEIESRLGIRALVLQEPETAVRGRLEGHALESWIDAVTLERVTYDITDDRTGSKVTRQRLSAADASYATAAAARTRLVEALAEVDSKIVDAFLGVDGDHLQVPAEEVRAAVRRATLASRASPVLLGAAARNIGVQPLLDAVVDYLPAPTDRPAPVPLDPSAPLVAFAFKVTVDAQRGPMVFVRVYSGKLHARASLDNATRGGVRERAMRLVQMYADATEEISEIACGHIGVVLGLHHTRTGDTLLDPHHPSLRGLHGIAVPRPVFFCAVEADSPRDERPLAEALAQLQLEDPSLHVSFDEETGQTLVSGMGELHLDIVRTRLLGDLKANASFGALRVSYREAASREAAVEHTHMREPSHAAMRVSVAPLPESDDNAIQIELSSDIPELEHDTVRAAIEDGINSGLQRGTLLGFPITRTRVHVDSVHHFGVELTTPAALRVCARQALARAFAEAAPQLLEPTAHVDIRCPEKHLGAVLGDLNGERRAHVLSLGDDAEVSEKAVVAEVPLAAMVGYASTLRSLTAGTGSFSMKVVGFGPMPQHRQQQVIRESLGYTSA
ncbi:P-loop containing nucleoside triphosphate hydrolase protein [Coemansia reversa NRRL 1564]|uniref:Elongation factor 2 n=1 Tax=Coemansia reversa (strain ATCC 12441 / NRRL 1564) TaxID=763665 RepID=A0A2G5BB83_COERN|nr:P-loop containing nucleoside triphosphate hydrolase protein [Coemansia reversa NRRL 1564]|eukprot:PIA16252.1 P-loop containing nucleoside triphosphate hydrolase protein [Coemansia reversa NRRL 1564]